LSEEISEEVTFDLSSEGSFIHLQHEKWVKGTSKGTAYAKTQRYEIEEIHEVLLAYCKIVG
jgi:hypothetical protein